MKNVWMALSLVVIMVLSVVTPGRGNEVAAQDGTPGAGDEAMSEGVGFEILSTGSVDAFPELPADLQLYRVTFAPGVSVEASPDPAVTLIYVETGAISMLVEGDVTVVRTPGPEGPEAVETFAAGEEFTLEATDSVLIPLTALGGEVRNEGSDEASLLFVNLISFANFASADDARRRRRSQVAGTSHVANHAGTNPGRERGGSDRPVRVVRRIGIPVEVGQPQPREERYCGRSGCETQATLRVG